MAEPNNVDIVIYFGGQWSNLNGSVSYDRSPITLLNISRRTTFDELEYILCEELGFLGRTEYKLHIYFKLITVNFGERSETVLPIKKDRDLKKFFNPRNGYASIDVFVEAEKLPENIELGYPGSSSYATPSNYAGPSDNAGPSSYVGQSNYAGPPSNAGTSAYNEEDDDPEGDSLLYNESSDSICLPYKNETQGFRYCRNVISVDGTHLYTRYKHKLLVAVTLDANNQVLPLAFALVDEETLASWTWFLQMLARHFLPNEDDRVCLISDRHPGLINAINYVPAFKFPRGVHRFCLRHVCSTSTLL
ncbi:UNVERIFIED_CONTAM: hypothetical protein Sradi_2779100 [Sesamum radiatum]|uniref:MULE transposase domain-containing protein n=1 Tax=Sesamum radiatum TaxID=300843 RepID=A0AAW2RUM2_SESRA